MNFNEKLGFKNGSGVRAAIENIEYYPFHFHETYIEIICVLSGAYTIHDSAVEYRIHEHDIHIFNSCDPHKIEAIEDGSSLLLVHIDKKHYLDDFGASRLLNGYFISSGNENALRYSPENRLLRFMLATAYTEYIKEKPSTMMLDNLAKEIIELLFSQFHDYIYEKSSSGNYSMSRRVYDGKNEEEYYRVYRIADYIEDNFYREKISLNGIAQMEYLTPQYLSRYIKENIGITFSELVSITRCSEAERLLANTNRSIEEIAADVGFTDRSHLFRHFKKWFAKSPADYRKAVLADIGVNPKIRYTVHPHNDSIKTINEYLNG